MPGILRLSPETRHLIYHYVWVGSGANMSHRYRHVFNLGPQRHDVESEELCSRFHPLLLSCRTIYAETAAMLYSTGRFVVRCTGATQPLAYLRVLTPLAVSSLTSLKLVLNQASCHQRGLGGEYGASLGCCDALGIRDLHLPFSGPDGDCVRRARYLKVFHGGVHDRPLPASDPATKAFFAEWQEVAAHLARSVLPGQLELALVCELDPADPGAIDAANLVVDSLRRLPQLRVCRVRLSRAAHPQLRQLAEDAVLRGRGTLPPDSPSGPRRPAVPPASSLPLLTALPEELRLHILEYTDLVTPRREVLWAAPRRSPALPRRYVAMRRPCEGRDCPDHGCCPFHDCVHASGMWAARDYFCGARHAAAASSSSSRCRCWMPPTPLFLVCRALREDAERVFWSGNRFVVIDGAVDEMWGPPLQGAYPEGRLAASHFFRGAVPARCLGHLRWVELVFRPRKAGEWPRRGDAVLADWCDSGLAGFYARLAWPLWRTEATRQAMGWENPDLRAETLERARREELRLSEQAERLVLGDRYGTVAGGREGAWRGPVVEYDSKWWWLHER